jgi:hypothetical protein
MNFASRFYARRGRAQSLVGSRGKSMLSVPMVGCSKLDTRSWWYYGGDGGTGGEERQRDEKINPAGCRAGM